MLVLFVQGVHVGCGGGGGQVVVLICVVCAGVVGEVRQFGISQGGQ